ncbi:MAG: transposase, partial [Verrucomicrobia bacterium]|nr:transposase [Verrucomicrobiota bacterium]
GAVRPDDGYLVTAQSEVFNAETYLMFLKQVIRHRRRGKKQVIIVDNARYHRARLLRPWLDDHRNTLCLDYLPPYSPELNHIERVWKLTRRFCTHNRYFPELRHLVDAVQEQFAMWKQPNTMLRRLCAVI